MGLSDKGGCMLAQIVGTVQQRIRSSAGGAKLGRPTGKTNKTGKAEKVPRKRPKKSEMVTCFTPDEVAAEFDIIFQELYGDGKEPYGKKGWRDLGVTTRMCSDFCERKDIGLRVLYKNHVIYRNTLEGDKNKPVIVYHIHSNQAFFYDNPRVKQAASQLRPLLMCSHLRAAILAVATAAWIPKALRR